MLKGAEQAVGGILGLATASDSAAVSATGLAGAESALAAAQTALLAPLTAMVAESTQLAAVLVSNVAGFGEMAAAEGLATAATVTLESALLLLESPLVIILAALAALGFAIKLTSAELDAFSKSEDSIARIAIQMKNLGNVFPTDELVEFAGQLSRVTGIDDEVIASLGAAAVQYGLTRKQAEELTRVTLDVATANKVPFEEAEKAILRATSGQTRGLAALHINAKALKGDLKDVDNLLSQIGAGFEGTAAGFRNTLPGTQIAFATSWQNLLEAGGRFQQGWIVILNALIFTMDEISALLNTIANILHLPTAADLGKGKPNELALKGDPEQTAALQNIDRNTAALDPFIKHVIGGRGDVARRAVTWRDQRMALSV